MKADGELDLENALAQIEANERDAPEIKDMAPANYTGGSLKTSGGLPGIEFGAVGGGGAVAVNTAIAVGAKGIVRGGGMGGQKRIAPTPVHRDTGKPLVGPFGTTLESGIEYARTLTAEQRRKETERLQREIAALVVVENECQQKDCEDNEEDTKEDVEDDSEEDAEKDAEEDAEDDVEKRPEESKEADEEPKTKRQKRLRNGKAI